MSTEKKPLTPAEAREYEATMRRQLWIGLAVLVAVVVVLIVAVMEARYREGLGASLASGAPDGPLQTTPAEVSPAITAPPSHR